MAKSTDTCNSILALIFNATTWADIAENDTTGPLANLYISLHTGDPGVSDDQTVNEATYTPYARLPVARTAVGWEVPAAGSTSNAAIQAFAECTVGIEAISHVAIGTTLAAAGTVLYAGALSAPRTISPGIQPQFNANTLIVTET